MANLRIGSDDHKRLFCGEFTGTFRNYDVRALKWPQLDEASLARLRAMPFWAEAVSTERTAGARVRLMADAEPDRLVREAIAMQSYEETRHAALLTGLIEHCGIELPEIHADKPRDAEWGFMRMGYGEVFDSFFAFGLFKVAEETGFFPPELIRIFEPFIEEEARHILFFVNWAAYRRRNLGAGPRAWFQLRRASAIGLQAMGRMQTAVQLSRGGGAGDDFVMDAHGAIDQSITMRKLAETCLVENERRLAPYDERLLRPTIVPRLVRLALNSMPHGDPRKKVASRDSR